MRSEIHNIDISNMNNTFDMTIPSNIDIVPAFNVNDKELIAWFDAVIYFYTKLSLICFLFVGISLWDLNIFSIFGVLIAFDIYNLFNMILSCLANSMSQFKTTKFALILIEKISFLCYYLVVLIYILVKNFYMIFSSIPLFMYLFTRCLLYYKRKTTDCISVMDFCIIISRIYFFIQNTLLAVKLDNFANWSWKEVFWSFWIFFSILIGVSLGIFLLFITKLCQSLSEINSFYLTELKSLFWVLCLSSNLTILSCLLVLSLIDFYDNNISMTLFQFVYVLVSFWGCMMLLSFFLKKDILKFFHHLNSQDLMTSARVTELHDKSQIQEHEPESILTIPKFLLKFSSTYFKRAPEQSMQSILNKKKMKMKERQIANKTVKLAPLKKAHSLTDIHSIENPPTNIGEIKDINNLLLKKYASINKDDKTTQQTQINQLFTTNQENFLTLNENMIITEHDVIEKKTPGAKKEQLEIIIFEDEQDNKTSGKEVNILNQLKNYEANTNITSKNTEKKLKKDNFENDPIFIDKAQFSNNDRKINNFSDNSTVGFRSKSLQLISSNKVDMDQLTAKNDLSAKNDESFPSGKLEKSLLNCLICFDKTPDSVFMECGHGGICYECALEVWRNTSECFLCRNKIQQVLQIDLNFKHENYIKVLTATQAQEEEN